MPYIRKGKCVFKKTGKKMGCSKTTKKAKAHMRALYAAESFNSLCNKLINDLNNIYES